MKTARTYEISIKNQEMTATEEGSPTKDDDSNASKDDTRIEKEE
jgi:hypothetical protein